MFSNLRNPADSPLWGRFAVPRTPFGYYRSWAQACDAGGVSRTHCAYAADAGGICKQRGDHWDPREFNNLMRAALGTQVWYGRAAYITYAGHTVRDSAITLSAYFDSTENPPLRGWANYWSSLTGLPETLYFVTTGAVFRYYRLINMANALYSDAVWAPYTSMGVHFIIGGADQLGNPWLNAI